MDMVRGRISPTGGKAGHTHPEYEGVGTEGPQGPPGLTGQDGPRGLTGPAGVTTATEVEVDFGTDPQWSKTFTISDGAVSEASMVLVYPSGNTATGRTGDDFAWDAIMLAAAPGSGIITVTAVATPGPVVGKRKIFYQVI